MSSSLLPVAVYGLEVPPGEVMVPAHAEFPATIRITMAAIDPTEEPEADEDGNLPSVPRSTLKVIKARLGDLDDDEDDDEDGELAELLANGGDDDEESDSDDEPNGGPSDPSKSKKARQEAAIMKLIAAAQEEDSDEEMEVDSTPNGTKSKKGKERASDEDDEESDDDSDLEDSLGLEQYVVCTLDTERNYQQPLDVTIGDDEKVFFIVSGTHTIHLTGNYVINEAESDDEDDDDDDYDLPPDLEDVLGEDEDEMSDDLDDLDHMDRVKEIDTDEEEAPKLVEATTKKGKNKRTAAEAAENLDDMISKESKGESKLSKKQLKKLKNNKGEAVAAEAAKAASKETPTKADKKVQFAKNLEQGPTGSAEKAKQSDKKAAPGVKVVQGVTIDDRKVGSGRAAKSGDKVGMRYIGKLQSNGKVFDSNKKGAPFSFKLGKGEVIKGWDIGVAGMCIGGERRLIIPPNLAYGNRALPEIPANSTLVFDVKLLEIK